MPKAANALHSHQISTAQAGVAKSVVGCNAGAEEWGSLCRRELVRNGGDAARFSDHHFCISAIHGDSRYHRVLTIHHVSTPARFAHAVFTGDQTDANALADFPFGHAAAQGVNAANDFMP